MLTRPVLSGVGTLVGVDHQGRNRVGSPPAANRRLRRSERTSFVQAASGPGVCLGAATRAVGTRTSAAARWGSDQAKPERPLPARSLRRWD